MGLLLGCQAMSAPVVEYPNASWRIADAPAFACQHGDHPTGKPAATLALIASERSLTG